jgi:hypothetical protein
LEFNRKQAAAYMRAHEHRKELSNVQPGKTFDSGLKGAMKLLAKPRANPCHAMFVRSPASVVAENAS